MGCATDAVELLILSSPQSRWIVEARSDVGKPDLVPDHLGAGTQLGRVQGQARSDLLGHGFAKVSVADAGASPLLA